MSYELGNPELDERVAQLVADAADSDNQDLIAELITTVIKLHRDNATRGDLKLINTALKEMRYSNLVFSSFNEPKVTVFGSARLAESDPNFQLAVDFAADMVGHGWGVITGAGPGIMEAGSKGAESEHSYGVNIRLPFEDKPNPHLLPDKTVNFKYFFTRKLGFVKESHAFAIFPGGWGTLDETFELLTLIQTGKSDLHPIVLIEAEGTGFWDPLLDFISDVQAARGLISRDDMSLYLHTTDPEGGVRSHPALLLQLPLLAVRRRAARAASAGGTQRGNAGGAEPGVRRHPGRRGHRTGRADSRRDRRPGRSGSRADLPPLRPAAFRETPPAHRPPQRHRSPARHGRSAPAHDRGDGRATLVDPLSLGLEPFRD
jgi:uncharacterized protein (TIGR00730 family)